MTPMRDFSVQTLLSVLATGVFAGTLATAIGTGQGSRFWVWFLGFALVVEAVTAVFRIRLDLRAAMPPMPPITPDQVDSDDPHV